MDLDIESEVMKLALWEYDEKNGLKQFYIKRAYQEMVKRQLDYEYRGVKGFFKLMLGK